MEAAQIILGHRMPCVLPAGFKFAVFLSGLCVKLQCLAVVLRYTIAAFVQPAEIGAGMVIALLGGHAKQGGGGFVILYHAAAIAV